MLKRKSDDLPELRVSVRERIFGKGDDSCGN
jgi:hypothetical protein